MKRLLFILTLYMAFFANHATAQNEFLYEDFSSGSYFILYSGVEAGAYISNNKAFLTGGTTTSWWGNGDATTDTNAWTDNYDHRATCSEYIDAGNYNAVELKIKIRQIAEVSTKHSWFRVLVNGYQRTDVLGKKNFNPTTLTTDNYTTLTFNLNDVAGSNFVLSMQSSCKLQLLDAVMIDEVRLIYNNLDEGILLPFSQNFSGPNLPMAWATTNDTASFAWEIGETTAVTGGNSYVYTQNISGDGASGINMLSLPALNLSYQQNTSIQFDLFQSTPLYLLASTDTGATWADTIATFNGVNSWQTQTASIAAYDNYEHLMIAFASFDTSDNASVIAIDNVTLSAQNNSAIELSIDTLLAPAQQTIYTQNEQVSIRVSNNSPQAISNFQVFYQVNDGFAFSETIAGPLAANTSVEVVFSQLADLTDVGVYTLKAWTSKPYDTNNLNDTIIEIYDVVLPTITNFPYVQSFEGEQFWTQGGVNSSWELGIPSGSIINNASDGQKAWVTNLSADYNSYEYSQVTSPVFDFSAVALPVIEFDIFLSTVNVEDGACIQYSTNLGSSWQTIGAEGDDFNWYNAPWVYALFQTNQFNGWSGEPFANWVTAKHELPALAGEGQVRFRFFFGSSDNFTNKEGFAFDQFKVYEKPINDLALIALNYPNYDCVLSALEPISIAVKNLGIAQTNGFTASYSIDGSAFISEPAFISVLPDSTINYTFSSLADLSSVGTHTIVVAISNSLDDFSVNDTLSVTLDFVPPASLPFSENFESGLLGANWSLSQADDSDGWLVGNDLASNYFNVPAHSTYAASNDDTCFCDMSRDYLITPYFDFSAQTNIILDFAAFYSGSYGSSAHVLVSTDCGNTWTNVYDLQGNDTLWQDVQVDLSAFSGSNNVKIAFHHNDNLGWSGGFAVDDILISADQLISSQEIPLHPGWGIMSTYIDPINSLFDTVCVDLLPNLKLMKSGTGGIYWPVFSVNSIGYFTIGEGYQYLITSSDTLIIEGTLIQPDQNPVSIPQGWSVIAYLRTQPGALTQMISTINSSVIILKDEYGSVYWPAFSLDMIQTMQPGKGYQLKTTSAGTLIYPAN